MNISRANRILLRILATLGAVGGLIVLYISLRGPASFPERQDLVQVSGNVTWTKPDRYSINFQFTGDPRTFSYARKSGDIASVAAALKSQASQPITVLVLPEPQGRASQPFHQVYELSAAGRPLRILAQVRDSWRTDYWFGYLAALMALLAAAGLEFVVRRSQPNNSSKPTPLRGAA